MTATVFFGILLVLWGLFIFYSFLFRMKQQDYKDTGYVGTAGFFEIGLLFKLLRKNAAVMKIVVILTGILFIVTGIYFIV